MPTPLLFDRYRLDRLIDSTPACEAHAGWDEQLDRPVRLIRVPLVHLDPTARERWRREVRALSAVTHPALVHVLDVTHHDGADWVITEWVEGEPLDVLVARQPLAGTEAARLAAEIAEALATAHRHGVARGSLPAACIVLTAAGHVKVDGLCTPRWSATDQPQGDDAPLEARAASDLRGLGEALVLAAGGVRPSELAAFPSRAALAAELVPTSGALAEPLAEVIARCLCLPGEQPYSSLDEVARELHHQSAAQQLATTVQPAAEPEEHPRKRWPRWLAAGLLLVLAAGGATGWWVWSHRRPLVVGVLPVELPEDSEQARLAATAVTATTTSALAALPNLVLVDDTEIARLRRQGRSQAETARLLALDELVEIKLTRVPDTSRLFIELARRRARNGQIAWSRRLAAETWDPAAVRALVHELMRGAYRGDYASDSAVHAHASAEAYRSFTVVAERMKTGRLSPDRREEIELLQRALDDSPRFTEGWVASTSLHYSRFSRSLAEEDRLAYETVRDRARAAGAAATMLAPNDIRLALRIGDTSRAVELARGLVHANPDNPLAWELLARALAASGTFAEAETAFARSLRLYPSASAFRSLARARSNRGDHAGARAALAEASRLVVAGDPDQMAGEAEIEMYAGDLALAERLFREVVGRKPAPQAHSNLGVCLYYQGRIEEAAMCFRQALELSPASAGYARNLADALVALGDRDTAVPLLEQALAQAERSLARGIRDRSTLEARAVCLAHLGRGPEAAHAADEMLRANPHHPETLFAAAVVATLTGDHASALAWSHRAIEANAPRVWFEAPELAELRRDPELVRLLATRR